MSDLEILKQAVRRGYGQRWRKVSDDLPEEMDRVECKYEGVYKSRIVTFWRDTSNPHFGLPTEKDGKGSQPATHWRPV